MKAYGLGLIAHPEGRTLFCCMAQFCIGWDIKSFARKAHPGGIIHSPPSGRTVCFPNPLLTVNNGWLGQEQQPSLTFLISRPWSSVDSFSCWACHVFLVGQDSITKSSRKKAGRTLTSLTEETHISHPWERQGDTGRCLSSS